MLSADQIHELKERQSLAVVARDLGANLRKSGRKLIGSCPICGGGKTASRFEIKDNKSWVCAVCCDGGDVIRLVQSATGRDFSSAIEYLGGARQLTDDEQRRLRDERAAEEKRAVERADKYRANTIAWQKTIWDAAQHADTHEVISYLEGRKCELPATAEIRCVQRMQYFHGSTQDDFGLDTKRVIHEGPAMIAATRSNAGEFMGLRITWIDPVGLARKAHIIDPDTDAVLPAKKMKGSSRAGHIILRHHDAPRRLFIGEGIETVLSVATALRRARAFLQDDVFWSSGDLGNLGGPAAGTIKHSVLKHANGHAVRFPSPEPDRTAPAIEIPASVQELFLIGDGDSEFEMTDAALERAARRYHRPGLTIRKCFAPRGFDFNDVISGKWPPPKPTINENNFDGIAAS